MRRSIERSQRRVVKDFSPLRKKSLNDDSPSYRRLEEFSARDMDQKYGNANVSFGDGFKLDVDDLENSFPVLQGATKPLVPQLDLPRKSRRKSARKNKKPLRLEDATVTKPAINSVRLVPLPESERLEYKNVLQQQEQEQQIEEPEKKDEPEIIDPLPNIKVPTTIKLLIQPHLVGQQSETQRESMPSMKKKPQIPVVHISPRKKRPAQPAEPLATSPRQRLSQDEPSPQPRRICEDNFIDYLKKTLHQQQAQILVETPQKKLMHARSKSQLTEITSRPDKQVAQSNNRIRRIVDMHQSSTESWANLREQFNNFRQSQLGMPSVKNNENNSTTNKSTMAAYDSTFGMRSNSEMPQVPASTTNIPIVKRTQIQWRRKTDDFLSNMRRQRHSTKNLNQKDIRKANQTQLEPEVKPITKLPAQARFAPMIMEDYNFQTQSRQLPTFDRQNSNNSFSSQPKTYNVTLSMKIPPMINTSDSFLTQVPRLPIRKSVTNGAYKVSTAIQASPSSFWHVPETRGSFSFANSTIENEDNVITHQTTLKLGPISEIRSQHEQKLLNEVSSPQFQHQQVSQSRVNNQERSVVYSSRLTFQIPQDNNQSNQGVHKSAVLLNQNKDLINLEGTLEDFRTSNAFAKRRLSSLYFDDAN